MRRPIALITLVPRTSSCSPWRFSDAPVSRRGPGRGIHLDLKQSTLRFPCDVHGSERSVAAKRCVLRTTNHVQVAGPRAKEPRA